MGFLFSKIGNFINPYVLTLLACLLAALITLGYLYKEELKTSAIAQEEVVALQASIALQNQQIAEEQARTIIVEVKRQEINAELSETKRQLDRMKNRQETVKAKPKLVAMKVQKSFDELMTEIYCTTGEVSQCVK